VQCYIYIADIQARASRFRVDDHSPCLQLD
jgi:hypothetical protein